ncbi:hypothetical protein [Lichenibacterium dinghuense]|uniref:hypothetical protein n=1 Tax=Lichenibacterium dinghuense TaxID=2895977 RepID=UPI001F1896F2|nr:hypothetical protein [Lichenibacterium sp. 6Y81]
MAIRFSTLVSAAAALTLLTAGAAQAQTTRKVAPTPRQQAARAHHPVVIAEISDATFQKPLVIQKRSFLDPGNVVPVGADTPANIVYNTSGYRPVYTSYAPAFFGTSELPGRFDLPPTNPRFNPSAEPRIPLPFE